MLVLRSSASAICSDWYSTGSTCPDCNWTTKFRSQRTSHTEPSATSTMVTGPVGERLQAGTEDAPVLDRPAPLRRPRDSGARYQYSYLVTYLLVLNLDRRSHITPAIQQLPVIIFKITGSSDVPCCRILPTSLRSTRQTRNNASSGCL